MNTMRNHTLNLFSITNLPELNFSYRLVATDLQKLPDKEDLYNRQMGKVAQKVASLTSGPAAAVHMDGKLFIAIPANRILQDTKLDIAPFSVKISLLPEVYNVASGKVAGDDLEVVVKFLDFEIRRQLSNNPRLWKLGTAQFFQKRPVQSDQDSTIEIFGGFNYKLLSLEKGQLCIALDITYKYIEKNPLSYNTNEANAQLQLRNLKGRKFLYQNWDNWYTIELVGFGKKIQDHEFISDSVSHKVYDYILSRGGRARFDARPLLRPDDITMFYKYPGRYMEPHPGASSLARMIYQTNDPEVKALHRFSIKDPSKRFETISKIVGSFFQQLSFNGKHVSINRSPVTEKVNQFAIPELLYHGEQVLRIGASDYGVKLRDFGHARKQYLMNNGVITRTGFDQQYIIIPETMDRQLAAAIKKNVEFQVRKLAPGFIDFKIIRYKADASKAVIYQVQDIEKVLKAQNALSGFALFVLPDVKIRNKRQITVFHDLLKSKFYPDLKVQCVSGYRLGSYFTAFTSNGEIEYRVPEYQRFKFRSYIQNLVFEYLLMNRKWPFALAENLHYDVYIGIDVHDRYAGFTFFFKNGRQIFFASEQVPKKGKSQRAEKVKAGLIHKVVYEKLKQYIPLYAPDPNAIIIIRDGRSFGEEEKALTSIMTELQKEGIVNAAKLKCGVVDLHKQSIIPLRIAAKTDSHNHLENPAAGTYKLIKDSEGFLFNTGYPFQIPGTAKPLHISLRKGELNFLYIMEDLFHQSMLAFSAPDRSNALPISIKLIDTLLEPLAAAGDQEEEEVEEDNETVDEEMENSMY